MTLPPMPRRKVPDGAILPLINIVFLLMVFFMLVGSMSPPETLRIDPARSNALKPADADARSLVVSADGRLAIGSRIFAREELPAQAATWQVRHAGQTLEVKADAGLEARTVVAILETLQAAGVVQVRLLAANAR